jgi:hypothetical protein
MILGCWVLVQPLGLAPEVVLLGPLYFGSPVWECPVSVASVGLGLVWVQRVLCGGMCGTKVMVWYGGARHCGSA